MHDAIIIISKKDDLDWSRLSRLFSGDTTQFLTVSRGCIVSDDLIAPFIMIPEVLPDSIIAGHICNFLGENHHGSVLALVHTTARRRLLETITKLRREGCINIHYFHHENNDPVWMALDRFLTSLEQGHCREELDKLLSLFPDYSIYELRDTVLNPLAAANLLNGDVSCPESKELWGEIRQVVDEVITNEFYKTLCTRASQPELTERLKKLLKDIYDDPPNLDREEFEQITRAIVNGLD